MPRRKSTPEEADTIQTADSAEMSTEVLEAPIETEAAAKPVKVKGERLSGDELLAFVKENKDNPLDEVIYSAGFYTKTTNAETGETKTTLHKPQFFEAIAAANGIELAPAKRAFTARKGRKPVVTVVKNGNIVVGSRHGSVAGFEPGSKVKIEAEHGRIVLTPMIDEELDGTAEDEEMDL
jgi:hypothetical protein